MDNQQTACAPLNQRRGQVDSLWLEWDQWDRVIDFLKDKKRVYGDFIVNTQRALTLMKSGKTKVQTLFNTRGI